jgi:hypothetical protein
MNRSTVTPPPTSSFDSRSNATAPPPYTVRPLPKLSTPWDEQPPASANPAVDVPPLLNETRDRTAVRPIPAQPVPARWASRRIEWPEQATGQSAKAATPPAVDELPRQENRRLNPRRIQLQRFDSDSSPSAPMGESGWRSARR